MVFRALPSMLVGMSRRSALLLPALLSLFAGPLTAAGPINYNNVVVFGDSLSDVGNTYNHPFSALASFFGADTFDAVTNGRFSNGPVWVEYLDDKLALPGSASSRSDNSGDNFAHGGARTGSGTLSFGVIDNVGRQVSNYTGSNNPTGSELFVLWAGGNDFFDNVGTPASVSANMASHITALANDGAERFLVMNLPKLGDVPRYNGTSNQATLNNKIIAYNDLLNSAVVNLAASLSIDITLFDVEATFDRLLSSPADFGFTNTSDPAFGNAAANPATYVFWDEIHPTTAAHSLLASAAFISLHDPGDFTGDELVNEADLQHVMTRYAQPTTPFNLTQGDWDGDGEVGMFEVDLVLANWTQASAVNVPEPRIGVLLVIGLGLGTRRATGRRRMLQ